MTFIPPDNSERKRSRKKPSTTGDAMSVAPTPIHTGRKLGIATGTNRNSNANVLKTLSQSPNCSRSTPRPRFPEPDSDCLQRAYRVLKAHGMTIDATSAHAMRHALKGVGDIARGVLPAPPQSEGE